MSKSDKYVYQPVNEPIIPHSQVFSCIQLPGFDQMVTSGGISTIQLLFERITQEIYDTRKKNYSWGFRVIEPEFQNFSDRIILFSKLYKEENLAELNSVIFKLFTEFNNIILATAPSYAHSCQGCDSNWGYLPWDSKNQENLPWLQARIL